MNLQDEHLKIETLRFTKLSQSVSATSIMSVDLECDKHIKFLKRHLSLLPSSHQQYDVNKMAIIFYSVVGLSALGVEASGEYTTNLKWIHKHYIKLRASESSVNLSGFVGSFSMDIPNANTISLPNTLFALLTLQILKDKDFFDNVLDRDSVGCFVSKCQLSDGSFVSFMDTTVTRPSPVDSSDLRFCYVAVAILYLIGCRNTSDFAEYIDVEKLIDFIVAQQCDVGGFGTYGESHAGYTSCALSALSLLGSLDRLAADFKIRTTSWLIHRQVSDDSSMRLQQKNPCYDPADHGGFQGRENKFADTCYVFWCLSSLRILNPEDFHLIVHCDLAKRYLISRTQNNVIGGFSKNDEDDPDVYHTCLGIAALKLIEGSFDGELFIPKRTIFF